MKTEMEEATRLTREGRLAEAAALIRRSLGMGEASTATRARVVEAPPIDVTSSSTREPAELAVPLATGAEPDARTSAPRPTDQRTPPHQAPAAPVTPPPNLSALLAGLPKPDTLGKVQWRDRSGRQFAPEIVAPAAGQWRAGVFTGESGSRAYKLYLPSGYHGRRLPLVVMLHGCTQSADDFAAGTRMNFVAEAEGLLVLFPEQAVAANTSRCWNWFQSADQQRGRGEPAILAGMTREVLAEHNVDQNRVFIAGLSAGGAMAAILAATYPELFAAVGVHSGLAPGKAHDLPSALQAMQGLGLDRQPGAPGRSIPLILFHGDRDSTVHPRNAEEFIRQWVGDGPDESSLRRGQVPGGKTYSCAVYGNPDGRTLVERWTIHGASHAWSGGSVNGSFTDPAGPNASQELVRFFREHPQPSA
ncbi:extracellular catalytic domain type 1 short-chain-length polyhydroxyalkanoate depolymerase [Pedosphaera parvula]|nr:PHB depolymerase family esterase [Pedosphaera parvula]